MGAVNKEIDNSIEEYHADTSSLSKTSLSMLLERPSRYYKHYVAPAEEREYFRGSKSLRLGNAVHCMVLEPKAWSERYIAAPAKSANSKCYRELKAINPGKTVLTITEYDQVNRMANALRSDPCIRTYLDLPGQAEKSFYWDDGFGIGLKCRPDYITNDSIYCLDIKTTKSIDPKAFAKDADHYKYSLSASMTLNGVQAVRGLRPQAYLLLCVENTGEKKPDVASYFIDADGLELGDYYFEKALETYKQCRDTGNWPAVSHKTQALALPSYRLKELERIRESRITSTWEIAG